MPQTRTIPLESLATFESLPIFRQVVAASEPSITIDGFDLPGNVDLQRAAAAVADDPDESDAASLRVSLHAVAALVLANLSHALELPWEKYLGEMHGAETAALRVVGPGQAAVEWSTLTMLLRAADPEKLTVVFGEALAVFSDGAVGGGWQGDEPGREGLVLAYHVRPGEDVLYTRVAGALMRPLTGDEVRAVRRVRETQEWQRTRRGAQEAGARLNDLWTRNTILGSKV